MKRFIRTGLVLSLALIMTISQATMVGFAANGNNGNGKGNIKQNEIKVKTQVTEQAKAELRERLRVMIAIGGGTWDGIPEGMAKKGYLPYGLAKRYMNGSFPYGLLKRMPNFQFGNQTENKNLINLKNLISSAEYRLSDYNNKTYENQEATKAALLSAINAAKVIAQKSSPTEIEVKNAYDALKAAVELFDGKELVGTQKLNDLKKIEKELLLYKSMLVIDITKPDEVAHLAKLNALIEKVQKYIGVDNAKLTLSIYNEIEKEAELFKNYLQPLKDLVKKVEAFVLANVKVGTAPGEYQLVDVTKINDEVAIAKAVIAANPPKSILEVEAAFKRLDAAFDVFQLKIILGTENLNIFKMLYAELEDAYGRLSAGTAKTKLAEILAEMTPYKDGTKPLTQEVLNKYLDAASAYLPDLYAAIKASINSLVIDANVMLDAYETTVSEFSEAYKSYMLMFKTNLIDVKVTVKGYIDGSDTTYSGLNQAKANIESAIAKFNEAVELLKKLKVAEGLITSYNTPGKLDGYTEVQLADLVLAKDALVAKITEVKSELTSKTVVELNNMTLLKDQLHTLSNNLIDEGSKLIPVLTF